MKTTTGALHQLQTMAGKIGEALQQDSESSEASSFGIARDTANHSERTTAVRLVQLQVSCLLRRCFVLETSANAARPTATECESLLIQLWNALHTSQRWRAYYAGLCAPLEWISDRKPGQDAKDSNLDNG